MARTSRWAQSGAARARSWSLHDFSTPGGKPASAQSAPRRCAVPSRHFRRPSPPRSSGRERRGDLPGEQIERQVPGRMPATAPAPAAACSSAPPRVRVRLAGDCVTASAKKSKSARRADVDGAATGERLAGVDRLGRASSSRSALDQPGQPAAAASISRWPGVVDQEPKARHRAATADPTSVLVRARNPRIRLARSPGSDVDQATRRKRRAHAVRR